MEKYKILTSDLGVRLNAANNIDIPIDILVSLADDAETRVREAVARNLKTPVDILIKLSQDTSFVRFWVARNPNTPTDILSVLSKDNRSRDVAVGVADNFTTPSHILAYLSRKSETHVAIATNPNTSADILLSLSKDINSDVRRGVACNCNTPIGILVALSEDREENVRIGVAANPHTPDNVLVVLSQDSEKDVRDSVSHNPKASEYNLKDEDFIITNTYVSINWDYGIWYKYNYSNMPPFYGEGYIYRSRGSFLHYLCPKFNLSFREYSAKNFATNMRLLNALDQKFKEVFDE